jgi:hypothetical protein
MESNGIRKTVIGVLAIALMAVGVMAGPVQARTGVSSPGSYGQYRREGQKIAFDKGYRTGLDKGDDDARHHRNPDPERSSHYRNADDGYHHEYGPKEEYRESYREGFRQGYSEAYRSYRHY